MMIQFVFEGVGPKRAIELMRQHRSIEEILKHVDFKVNEKNRFDIFNLYIVLCSFLNNI